MSYLINNQQKVNDIIFAGRNKDYGAYAIRSSYGNTLLKSMVIMITGFGSLILTAYYLCNKSGVTDISGQIVTDIPLIYKNTPVNLEPKTKPATKATAAPPDKPSPKQAVTNGALAIVDSAALKAPVKESVVTNGTENKSVTSDVNADHTDVPDVIDMGDSRVEVEFWEPAGVDSQPEFEGGLKALYKFLSSNMHYPPVALDENKEGIVYVKFVVDEKGKVGNLKLLNKTGYGMDEEALRVIAMLPNFKTPAKVKGRSVKMYYQLPIKFRLR